MKIASLLYCADWDRFSLAPFARSFNWTPAQVISLVQSLYLGYPIGEVVLWAPPAGRTAPSSINSPEMIVDGTQRMTAIYSAIRGRGPNFIPENKTVSCPLCFHVMSEQFAVLDLLKAHDPEWINLVEFFAPRTPAIGEALMALHPTLPKDGSIGESARRVNRLACIADRRLCVQYMPADATEDDCRELRRLIHANGN